MSGQVRWYVYDGLGSVLGEVDPSGNMTSSRKYDVYGLVRGGTNPGGTSAQKFVGALGHTSEDNTGLIYMRARYMDPALGRFTSEDPAGHGKNWFIYCHNNPISYTDPDGMDEMGDVMIGTSLSVSLDAMINGSLLTALALLACFEIYESQNGPREYGDPPRGNKNSDPNRNPSQPWDRGDKPTPPSWRAPTPDDGYLYKIYVLINCYVKFMNGQDLWQ